MARRARVRRSRVTGRWEVTHKGGTLWDFITEKRFDTWADAYAYADRWTRGPDRRQSDYTLARGGDAS